VEFVWLHWGCINVSPLVEGSQASSNPVGIKTARGHDVHLHESEKRRGGMEQERNLRESQDPDQEEDRKKESS